MKTISICDAIPEILKRLELSKRDFANEILVDESTINRYLSHDREPSQEIFNRIVNFINDKFGIDAIFSLLNLEDDKYYWHGSKYGIEGKINVEHNLTNSNDFGYGFYLGESFRQAALYICDSSNPIIYRFKKRDVKFFNPLILKENEEDIKDWLFLIAIGRRKIRQKDYENVFKRIYKRTSNHDVIVGKIADSVNFFIMDDFLRDRYDLFQIVDAFSRSDLGYQYAIKNQSVVDSLSLNDCFKVEKKLISYISDINEREHKKYASISNDILVKHKIKNDYLFSNILKGIK